MFRYKSKYKNVDALPIWIVKSSISSARLCQRQMPKLEKKWPALETLDLDFTIHIDNTQIFLYFNLELKYCQIHLTFVQHPQLYKFVSRHACSLNNFHSKHFGHPLFPPGRPGRYAQTPFWL